MDKTRSQTGKITIKKEEEKDCEPPLTLASASNTSNKNNLPAPPVKVEEDTDTKSLLKSTSKHSKLPTGKRVSQEQINRLIDYLVNHKMSIRATSRKAKLSYDTVVRYYKIYKNDPEKKIPAPLRRSVPTRKYYTPEQVENLIKYIKNDKMTVKEASAKANMTCGSGQYYYDKYLNDPNHTIPVPRMFRNYTQDEKNEFIGYIVNDKMNIKEASKKARMSVGAGRECYHKYFEDQHPDIAAPRHIATPKHYTQEQAKEAIRYIVDDNMSISAASKKANVHRQAATRHYRQYLKDHNMELPASKTIKRYTQDDIDELIGYIVNGKMTLAAASRKANMSLETVRKYYYQYLKDRNLDIPIPKSFTQDQIDEFIGSIVEDQMSIYTASKKANMSFTTGSRYYQRYLNKMTAQNHTKQDQRSESTGYIIDDKMTITATLKKKQI